MKLLPQVVKCSTGSDNHSCLLWLVLQLHIKAWEAPLPHPKSSLNRVTCFDLSLVVSEEQERFLLEAPNTFLLLIGINYNVSLSLIFIL